MKTRTFTQRWNITALKRIKKAYKGDSWYICDNSPEFKELWDNYRAEIRKLGIKYNRCAHIPPGCSGALLFYTSLSKQERLIRISFLNHEIARLTALRKANLG